MEVLDEPDPKYAMASDQKLSLEVFLNLEIDSTLLLEGTAREIVRRIQVMRKELDLDYDQQINLSISGDSNTNEVLDKYGEWIKKETLAVSLTTKSEDGAREWDLDGDVVRISVRSV